MISTCNVFDKYKVEDVVQLNIDLTDNHAGDVRDQEHQSEAEDTHQVTLLLSPDVFWHRSVPQNSVGHTDHNVDEEDGNGTNDCWQNDCKEDWGKPKLVVKIVINLAGKIHLFADNVIGQDTIDKGDKPDGTQGDLVHHS